jgi:putative transposase
LEYEAKEKGKPLVKIDQWFTSSKTCHVCQQKMQSMSLNIRLWDCIACHTHHDRNINAALNIKHQGILKLKAEGLSVSAHRGSRNSGMLPVAAVEVGSLAR